MQTENWTDLPNYEITDAAAAITKEQKTKLSYYR